jgi:DNA-directed RNA polymerase specialized sigma subunit
MSEAERVEFAQEIAIFVTTFASEVRELRQTIRSSQNAPIEKNSKDKTVREDDPSSSSKEEVIHKNDIASYLLEVHTPPYVL